jgi:hypothetical protein
MGFSKRISVKQASWLANRAIEPTSSVFFVYSVAILNLAAGDFGTLTYPNKTRHRFVSFREARGGRLPRGTERSMRVLAFVESRLNYPMQIVALNVVWRTLCFRPHATERVSM